MRRVYALALLACAASVSAARAPNPMCVDRATYQRYLEEGISKMPTKSGKADIMRRGLFSIVEPIFSTKESLSKRADRGNVEAQGQIAGIEGDCMLDGASTHAPGDAKLIRWLESAPKADQRALRVRAYFAALGWDGQPASGLRAYPHLLAAGVLKTPEGAIDDRQRHEAAFDAVLLRLLDPRLEEAMPALLSDRPGKHTYAARIEIDRCSPALTVLEAPEGVDKTRLQQELNGITALLSAVPTRCEGRAIVPLTLDDVTP